MLAIWRGSVPLALTYDTCPNLAPMGTRISVTALGPTSCLRHAQVLGVPNLARFQPQCFRAPDGHDPDGHLLDPDGQYPNLDLLAPCGTKRPNSPRKSGGKSGLCRASGPTRLNSPRWSQMATVMGLATWVATWPPGTVWRKRRGRPSISHAPGGRSPRRVVRYPATPSTTRSSCQTSGH